MKSENLKRLKGSKLELGNVLTCFDLSCWAVLKTFNVSFDHWS